VKSQAYCEVEREAVAIQLGWCGMGILVSPKYRRQSIASFLSSSRIEVLRRLGVKEFYSIVDANNLTSMKTHQNFGYIEVARAPGFLHIGFNDGVEYLFKMII
jgi:L-amino acid N-acyltransferase YncA